MMAADTRLETTLQLLLDWIAAADSKTNTLFGFATAMLGVLVAVAPPASGWDLTAALLTGVAALLLATSLLLASLAAFPRTAGPEGSLLYFRGIVTRDAASYLQAVRDASGGDYLEDLANQCHRNAEIADTKFLWIQRAMIALYLSVLPWLAALYFLYT